MLVYANVNTVITYNMEFKSITILDAPKSSYGRIVFDNSNYLNITDANLIGDGYIDLYDGIVYWRNSKYESYVRKDVGTLVFKDYNGNDTYCKITYYDNDALTSERYSLYAKSDVDSNAISIIHTELRCNKRKYIRPVDGTQDWVSTEEIKDNPECEVVYDSCECGIGYQWVLDGYICSNYNKCEKLKYQYRENCDSEWVDVLPLIYKIGNVVEEGASECLIIEKDT